MNIILLVSPLYMGFLLGLNADKPEPIGISFRKSVSYYLLAFFGVWLYDYFLVRDGIASTCIFSWFEYFFIREKRNRRNGYLVRIFYYSTFISFFFWLKSGSLFTAPKIWRDAFSYLADWLCFFYWAGVFLCFSWIYDFSRFFMFFLLN